MNTVDIVVPEPKEIEKELSVLAQDALAMRVTDNATMLQADEMLSAHMAMKKKIKEFFKPEKEAADKLHKQIVAKENAELAKVIPGETHLKQEIGAYKLAEQRKREAEESRLRIEAAKREEEDRIARAAEIEAEAARLRASGQAEIAEAIQAEAEEVLNTPSFVPAPRVAAAPKTRSTLKMIVDRQAIEQVVSRLKDKTNIPGVRVYAEWKFDVYNESMVPEHFKKASVGGRV